MFLLSTGCRLNEALRATWGQIDRGNRVWRIPASNSKSKRVRSVPLNDSALDVLAQLDTEGRVRAPVRQPPHRASPTATIMKVWSRLRSKAGLPHLRIHDLRHQYASFLVNSGRSLYEVQQILGHSDPSVTQRYAHLSSRSLQEAANSASVAIRGQAAAAGCKRQRGRRPCRLTRARRTRTDERDRRGVAAFGPLPFFFSRKEASMERDTNAVLGVSRDAERTGARYKLA